MAENSLSPAFVRINYTSSFGAHSMTVPSVPYNVPTVGAITGTFDLRGAELDTPAGPAIVDYVNLLRAFFPNTVNFVDYTIFTQEDEDSPATPQYSAPLGIAGNRTLSTGEWQKANQITITFRTEAFGIFKVVLLDCGNFNSYNKFTAAASHSTALTALNAYILADESWLAGRDGAAPNVFLQIATTLNEKLRKAYGMN